MSEGCGSFGIDLNAVDCSSYELHPSSNDSKQTLQGNYCATIRLRDPLTTNLLSFVENYQCKPGKKIGTIQFTSSMNGIMTLDERIDENFTNCKVNKTEEQQPQNIEIYQTEFDPYPSNAMFLRRKGFVHSKLTIQGNYMQKSVYDISHHQHNILYFVFYIAQQNQFCDFALFDI